MNPPWFSWYTARILKLQYGSEVASLVPQRRFCLYGRQSGSNSAKLRRPEASMRSVLVAHEDRTRPEENPVAAGSHWDFRIGALNAFPPWRGTVARSLLLFTSIS